MTDITVLGIFVTDMTFFAERQPLMGESIIGRDFTLGPGGKGANQAIAASRLGATVNFISRLGQDEFAEMALSIFEKEGINPLLTKDNQSYTGAASIFVNSSTLDNAIIVDPGAAKLLTKMDVIKYTKQIQNSKVFLTQLEQPLEAALTGLSIARKANITTILNPAPATEINKETLSLCDYLTPNETEAETLCGVRISNLDDAIVAAKKLQEMGPSNIIITLGESGALFQSSTGLSNHIKSFKPGPLKETTGAGDCFNGALARCIAKEMPILDCIEYACTAAGISVTRSGTANSMPSAMEVTSLVKK